MGGIGVITNPMTRHNRRNPRLAGELAYILGERGDLESPGDLDALSAAALRFRARDIDVLCINGGDGTIHKALTSLVRAYGDHPLPRIALLRGGTMNIVANSVGVALRPAEMLAEVVASHHGGLPLPTTRRWLLRVTEDDPGAAAPARFGFLFGCAIIARFLEVYYERGEPTPARAAWLLLRGTVSALVGGRFVRRLVRPWHGQVEVDGATWPGGAWTASAVGSVEQIGLGFTPFPDVTRSPGQFQAWGIGGTVVDLAVDLPRVYRGAPPGRPGNRRELARRMVLESDAGIDFMLDGDFYRGSRRVTLEIGPAVEFLGASGATLRR